MLPGVAFFVFIFFWAAGAAAYPVETTIATLKMPFPLSKDSVYELHHVGMSWPSSVYHVAEKLTLPVNATPTATSTRFGRNATETRQAPVVLATLTISYNRAVLQTAERKTACHWLGGVGVIATCVNTPTDLDPKSSNNNATATPSELFTTPVLAVKARIVQRIGRRFALQLTSPFILIPVAIMVAGFAIIFSCGFEYDSTPSAYYHNPW